MRINFLLPFFPKHPVGGFKVHYEYASRLSARGHEVTVVHPCTVEEPRGWKARLSRAAKRTAERRPVHERPQDQREPPQQRPDDRKQ